MAFQDFTIITPSTAEVFKEGVFNLTQAVGSKEVGTGLTAANTKTDMMLIYYLLFFIYKDGDKSIFPSKDGDNFGSPEKFPNAKDFNSNTTKTQIAALILRAQKDLKRNGRNVFVDGRCDRARGSITTITHSVFTLLLLNFHFANTIKRRENREDWQNFLLNDPFAPFQLRQELATNLEI
jgi:hypothetical protein